MEARPGFFFSFLCPLTAGVGGGAQQRSAPLCLGVRSVMSPLLYILVSPM